jgi:putative glutathione S-transferase
MMGKLVNGIWQDTWYDTASTGGAFQRDTSKFRNWITPDGTPGPTGSGGFAAQTGRYHLYVSYACPWAHRALIFRALKGLQDHIGVSVVHPDMLADGWTFADDFPGATGDRLAGRSFLRDLYVDAKPDVTGRVTVPVLFDTETGQIVSNESAEIIRMLNSAFDTITGNTDDFWPAAQRDQIEAVNQRIYDTVNNGVYLAGFATTQGAYDAAVGPLFDTLDWLEDRLSHHRYLMGDRITEADWRLFTTLIRFDAVYHGHFKCNRRRIVDYPNLWAYTRELYQWPGIADTVRFDHFIRHYYYSHDTINPYRIVPTGPILDLDAPHRRGQRFAA